MPDIQVMHQQGESHGINNILRQLRLKLLDLTGRNRLINYKHSIGKSLQFVEGDPATIYQKLVEANNRPLIFVHGLPEPGRIEWVERNGRLSRPDPRDWARQQGISTSYDLIPPENGLGHSHVRALLYPDDLAKHCRKIERESVLAIEETGANMLFLVLGFLEFPDQKDSDRIFTAPLISIPVSMMKVEKGSNQVFSLQFTGDDVAENLSLREKLKNDYGLILPELDEDQIDVEGYFSALLAIIKNHPGFILRRRVSLCILSFSNMLLVRDLDPDSWPHNDNQNSLIDHPIVKVVFKGTAENSGYSGDSKDYHVEEPPGSYIQLVYDADSSQHSALVDALAHGKNLVIEGPPGTGKSQTITNLIAACIAQGKRVLFVAEKLAALEVVKNRLTHAGLDAFVLELHSNKTNKKRVLEEISKRIEFRPSFPSDLPKMVQQLDAHRSELKAYSNIINTVSYNSLGLTIHQVMWRTEKHRHNLSSDDAFLTQIAIKDAVEISEFEISRRMDCLDHLGRQYSEIGGFDTSSTFWGYFPDRMIPGDEIKLRNIFFASQEWAEQFKQDSRALSETLHGNVLGLSYDFANTQIDALNELLAAVDENKPLFLIPVFFRTDASGNKSRQLLELFSVQLQRFHGLQAAVQAGLRIEEPIDKQKLGELNKLGRLADQLGAELGTANEIATLVSDINRDQSRSINAFSIIVEFCKAKGIHFNGTRQSLSRIAELVKLVVDIPDNIIHLQSEGLVRDGCQLALESLSILQDELIEKEKALGEILYLDMLPSEANIKEAILTLREGGAWYRIFQGRWRKAVSVHKGLQRVKRRIPVNERLNQLEKVDNLIKCKETWKSHSAWPLYLRFAAPASPIPLNSYIELAKWNSTIKILLEDVGSDLIDLAELTPESARGLKREYSLANTNLVIIRNALGGLDSKLPKLVEISESLSIDKASNIIQALIEIMNSQLDWIMAEIPAQTPFAKALTACEAAVERQGIIADISSNTEIHNLLGEWFSGVDTDIQAALDAFTFGKSIDGFNLSTQIKSKLRSSNPAVSTKSVLDSLMAVRNGIEHVNELKEKLGGYGNIDLDDWAGENIINDLVDFSDALASKLKRAVEDIGSLVPWSNYVARRKETQDIGLTEFLKLLESKQVKPDEIAHAYAYCTYSTIVREAFRSNPQLGRFTGLKHNQIREEFRRIDKEIIGLNGSSIAANNIYKCDLPSGRNGTRVDDKTEMVLLNYLLPQQRPRMPVRKMLTRAGISIQTLKPCFMMGPQAVAQYLTPGGSKFDIVIMDEASQLKPEEAIGSIARGSQLIVVGDPKQLPPTSFFSRMTSAIDDEEQYTTTDAESILDVCAAQFQPTRTLSWHYRSQHHSLIAFSNLHFYRNKMIIFPSPYGKGSRLGVRATYLADAIYENQTNLREANRVVDAVAEHIVSRPDDSLGVVTLNIKQRDLIAELLEARLRDLPGADTYREKWGIEGQPIFIKNLENVQGDERDAIIISTTFGKPPGASSPRQNFGPISRQGGWRRLNVLFTRARKSVAIYTSLRPEDIVMDGSTPEGTKALRNYLEYARTGLLTTSEPSGLEPDSDFEVAVMDALRLRGYEVTPQLGVAGYRIDIAVKHPDSPGTYLAAIECDGASYHSALSVRDRDRIRQEILESLGWRGRIWRIWSTDWFRMPRQELDKLISFLELTRATWKPEHFAGSSWIEEGVPLTEASSQTSNDENVQVANESLLDTEDDLEVEVGDVVRYVEVNKPEDVLASRITQAKNDFPNGLISVATPLAQSLMGAVVGDEVLLHVAGVMPQKFRIIEIIRSQ